jgi:hypothetical protein
MRYPENGQEIGIEYENQEDFSAPSRLSSFKTVTDNQMSALYRNSYIAMVGTSELRRIIRTFGRRARTLYIILISNH